jgi:4-amino-4-deoxy-L-arabinose transferase-like glycosyltransferase
LFLFLHLIFAVTAVLVWLRAGRPSLLTPWRDSEGRFLSSRLVDSLRKWPDVWVLGTGITLIFLMSALLIWVTAPNNNDSLSTHLSRIGYWLQHGSFFPWPSQRVWQITYPVNMQLQMFWTSLFLGNDRLVEIAQWFGAVFGMVAVYGLARLFGAVRPQAFFSAFVWATFPAIILQSSTTQNDLVAGTLFAAMLYLLFLGLKTEHTPTLALAGLALALGLSTKQTLLFLLPGLGLVCVWYLILHKKSAWRSLLTWGASALAAFLLFGAYMFVVNLVHFGHPMGIKSAVSAQTGGQTAQAFRDNLFYNTFRLTYQSIDPTGLPDPLVGYGFKARARVTDAVTSLVGFSPEAPVAVATGHRFLSRPDVYLVQEDVAWYGPLFAFLVLPALIYQFGQGIRRKDPLRAGIFVVAISFLLVNAALRPGWDPYQGRYFIPVVTVAAAYIAFAIRPGRVWMLPRLFIVIAALTIAYNTFQLNAGKPLEGRETVWNTNWVQQQTFQSNFMREPVSMVEKFVPADATLGLLTYAGFHDYHFFRPDYSRRLVPVYPTGLIEDTDWVKSHGIEYLLVLQPTGAELPDQIPAAFVLITVTGDWTLYSLGEIGP